MVIPIKREFWLQSHRMPSILVVKIIHCQNSGTLQKSWFLGTIRILRYASNNNTVFTRVRVDPVYKWTPHFGAKKSFSLFLGMNFLEKLIFYLRIFFQVQHGTQRKKLIYCTVSWTFFLSEFLTHVQYKSRAIFGTDV